MMDSFPDGVTCAVRALAGRLVPGDVFDEATLGSGERVEVSLRVVQIWNYGREYEFLDAAFTARLRLSGEWFAALEGVNFLAVAAK